MVKAQGCDQVAFGSPLDQAVLDLQTDEGGPTFQVGKSVRLSDDPGRGIEIPA